MKCPDCKVLPGKPHQDGCDVARCTICGFQRITCEHGTADVGWGQIWTGTVVRPSQQKPTRMVECELCFALIYETRTDDHAYWHRIAASPLAHGLYITAGGKQ